MKNVSKKYTISRLIDLFRPSTKSDSKQDNVDGNSSTNLLKCTTTPEIFSDLSCNTCQRIRKLWIKAKAGDSSAQEYLGNCYLYGGRELKKIPEKAAFWFKLAAERGRIEAQYKLAYCYSKGIGVQCDNVAYAYWSYVAALNGHSICQYNFAQCLKNGIGVKKDEAMAIKWMKKSAKQNLKEARNALKEMNRINHHN